MARLLPSSSTIPSMMSDLDDEMTFSDGEECIVHHQTDLPNIALPVMDDIRRMDKLCDVTIKVGEHKYRSHRIVLAATIPYFHAMFMHGMKESRQDEIEIKGVEADAMEALINFAYSGKVTISTSSVHNLMMGASFLSLHRVREACEEFLIKRLTPMNVLGIHQFADALSCPRLMKACDDYVHRFFSVVSAAEEFLNLTFDKVKELISSDYLHASSEEIVFRAVIRWVKFDVDARQKQLPDLLNCVRMPLLRPQFLSDHVATEELVKSDHKCRGPSQPKEIELCPPQDQPATTEGHSDLFKQALEQGEREDIAAGKKNYQKRIFCRLNVKKDDLEFVPKNYGSLTMFSAYDLRRWKLRTANKKLQRKAYRMRHKDKENKRRKDLRKRKTEYW